MKLEEIQKIADDIRLIDLKLEDIKEAAVHAASQDDCELVLFLEVTNNTKLKKIEAEEKAKETIKDEPEGMKMISQIIKTFDPSAIMSTPHKEAVTTVDHDLDNTMMLNILDLMSKDLTRKKNILVGKLEGAKISF